MENYRKYLSESTDDLLDSIQEITLQLFSSNAHKNVADKSTFEVFELARNLAVQFNKDWDHEVEFHKAVQEFLIETGYIVPEVYTIIVYRIKGLTAHTIKFEVFNRSMTVEQFEESAKVNHVCIDEVIDVLTGPWSEVDKAKEKVTKKLSNYEKFDMILYLAVMDGELILDSFNVMHYQIMNSSEVTRYIEEDIRLKYGTWGYNLISHKVIDSKVDEASIMNFMESGIVGYFHMKIAVLFKSFKSNDDTYRVTFLDREELMTTEQCIKYFEEHMKCKVIQYIDKGSFTDNLIKLNQIALDHNESLK